MCGPALAVAATVAAIGQQVVQGVGQAQQANAAAKQARIQSRQASEDARQSILDTGDKERQYMEQAAQKRGQMRAMMAANGIDLSYGSAADFLADQAQAAQEGTLDIAKQGERQTMAYRISAANYSAEASAAKAKARTAIAETAFGVASTALGAARSAQNKTGLFAPPK